MVPHDLCLFEFLGSEVSIHRGGHHPATVSAGFDVSCGICWEILFLLRLRAMGNSSELGLNSCSTEVRWKPVTDGSLWPLWGFVFLSVKCTLQCGDTHGDLACRKTNLGCFTTVEVILLLTKGRRQRDKKHRVLSFLKTRGLVLQITEGGSKLLGAGECCFPFLWRELVFLGQEREMEAKLWGITVFEEILDRNKM